MRWSSSWRSNLKCIEPPIHLRCCLWYCLWRKRQHHELSICFYLKEIRKEIFYIFNLTKEEKMEKFVTDGKCHWFGFADVSLHRKAVYSSASPVSVQLSHPLYHYSLGNIINTSVWSISQGIDLWGFRSQLSFPVHRQKSYFFQTREQKMLLTSTDAVHIPLSIHTPITAFWWLKEDMMS